MTPPSSSLLRVDPLTGCANLLGFTEWVGSFFAQETTIPVTLLSLDVNRFSQVNQERGHAEGDAVLRWVGIVLRETSLAPVYRIGGDEFAVVLSKSTPEDAARLARRIYDRLSQEAEQIGLQHPPASLSVIHFSANSRILPEQALLLTGAAMLQIKQNFERGFHEFDASALLQEVDHHPAMSWFAGRIIENILLLGRKLAEAEELAYTDPLTGIPNQRAAARALESALEQAASQDAALAVILIDGDDLREYNAISYAAGDDMICRMAEILQANLRPGDFLARWRVGDEFLVVLPGAGPEQARLVGERLVTAVRAASQEWPLPVTISAGLASYPGSGPSAQALLAAAERANSQAKTTGKNRLVLLE